MSNSAIDHRRRRGLWLRLSVITGLIIAVIGVGGYMTAYRHVGPLNAVLASGAHVPMSKVTRTSGISHVKTDDPAGAPVIMRSCSHVPPNGVSTGECGVIDQLADGAPVVMRCWVDDVPASNDSHSKSPRWFYVNELIGGPHNGWSGYIYSNLIPVSEQIVVPKCTDSIYLQYQVPKPLPPPTVPLRFWITGSCTSAGGTLTGASSGFTPGGEYLVWANYPDGSQYPLDPARATTTPDGTIVLVGKVAANGTITWTWPCKGDPPGTYTTQVADGATGRNTGWVNFTIGSPPGQQAGNPPPVPTRTPTAPGPPPPAPPIPPPPPPPPTYSETTGGVAHTWTNYTNAGGSAGPTIAAYATVQISCKITGFRVADGNTWWYRIASSPWSNQFYVSADAFYNNGQTSGSLRGTPWVDPNVRDC